MNAFSHKLSTFDCFKHAYKYRKPIRTRNELNIFLANTNNNFKVVFPEKLIKYQEMQ